MTYGLGDFTGGELFYFTPVEEEIEEWVDVLHFYGNRNTYCEVKRAAEAYYSHPSRTADALAELEAAGGSAVEAFRNKSGRRMVHKTYNKGNKTWRVFDDKVVQIPIKKMNATGKPLYFHGKVLHKTGPFEGLRIPVVAFPHTKVGSLAPQTLEVMETYGYERVRQSYAACMAMKKEKGGSGDDSDDDNVENGADNTQHAGKRGRGRPSKSQTQQLGKSQTQRSQTQKSQTQTQNTQKRGPGRPRKSEQYLSQKGVRK